MFISSADRDFRRWSRFQAQKNSNDNDQPGGRSPVSLPNPRASGQDALMRLERTGTA